MRILVALIILGVSLGVTLAHASDASISGGQTRIILPHHASASWLQARHLQSQWADATGEGKDFILGADCSGKPKDTPCSCEPGGKECLGVCNGTDPQCQITK